MKIAVITGASSGIGQELARAIDKIEPLDEMWIISRRRERLEAFAKTLRTPARILALDLSSPTALEEYGTLLEKENPDISTLGNVSGFGKFALFEETPLKDLMGMVDVNDRAYIAMARMSLPYMHRGSRIFNVASQAAFQPLPYECIYGASKAFVLSFSRALNVELEPRGIRSMAICPGWVKTEFFETAVLKPPAVTYYNSWVTPEEVVERALSDYNRGRDVSIPNPQVRSLVRLAKILDHKQVMRIWMHQQKHDNRPPIN